MLLYGHTVPLANCLEEVEWRWFAGGYGGNHGDGQASAFACDQRQRDCDREHKD